MIEKHFTLDRNDGGPDDSFSLEPDDLAQLCRDALSAWKAVGEVDYGLKSSERSNTEFHRSLYAVQDIPKGDVIPSDNVRSTRPGYGLGPKGLDTVLGSHAKKDDLRGTAMQWELVG